MASGILIGTILAAWSRSPEAAAFHVFVFLASMLIVYYTYSTVLFGFFPKYYFMIWSGMILLSPIGGYLVWYARGNGWITFPLKMIDDLLDGQALVL